MAAGNAFNRHPAAFQNAIFLNGLIAILGTGGLKAAGGRRETGNTSLVKANEQQGDFFHLRIKLANPQELVSNFARCSNWVTAVSTSPKAAWGNDGRAINTQSQPGWISGKWVRTTSRSNRLARLRLTAWPTCRLATKAKRLAGNELDCTNRTTKGWRQLLPACRTRFTSAGRRKRWLDGSISHRHQGRLFAAAPALHRAIGGGRCGIPIYFLHMFIHAHG